MGSGKGDASTSTPKKQKIARQSGEVTSSPGPVTWSQSAVSDAEHDAVAVMPAWAQAAPEKVGVEGAIGHVPDEADEVDVLDEA